MSLRLLGTPMSPFVRKVRTVLHEKGLEYDYDGTVGPLNKPDWFLEASPDGRVPVLYDGEFMLPDSTSICLYLDRKYDGVSFYPTDPAEFGTAIWLEEYADATLAPAVGPGFIRAILFKAVAGEAPDLETCRNTLDNVLPPMLAYLEGQLGDRDWLVGDSMTIADIAVGSALTGPYHLGGFVWQDKAPKLAAWFERFLARDSLAPSLADVNGMLEKFGVQAPDFS